MSDTTAQQHDCPYCGPNCHGGACHNARAEDGAIWGSLAGDIAQQQPEVGAERTEYKGIRRCREFVKQNESAPRPAAPTVDAHTLQALRDEVATLKALASRSLHGTGCEGYCEDTICPHAALRKYLDGALKEGTL